MTTATTPNHTNTFSVEHLFRLAVKGATPTHTPLRPRSRLPRRTRTRLPQHLPRPRLTLPGLAGAADGTGTGRARVLVWTGEGGGEAS